MVVSSENFSMWQLLGVMGTITGTSHIQRYYYQDIFEQTQGCCAVCCIGKGVFTSTYNNRLQIATGSHTALKTPPVCLCCSFKVLSTRLSCKAVKTHGNLSLSLSLETSLLSSWCICSRCVNSLCNHRFWAACPQR